MLVENHLKLKYWWDRVFLSTESIIDTFFNTLVNMMGTYMSEIHVRSTF